MRPIKTVMEQRGRRMQFGQDPLIFTARDSFDGLGGELKIGRRISVLVESRVRKISPNELTIFRGYLACLEFGAVGEGLHEGRFYLAKSGSRKSNHAWTSKRQLRLRAVMQKRRQRH